jgi:hypothetical protein
MTAAFGLLMIAVLGVIGIILVALLMASWRRFDNRFRPRDGERADLLTDLDAASDAPDPADEDPWLAAGRRLQQTDDDAANDAADEVPDTQSDSDPDQDDDDDPDEDPHHWR